jgi:perosamine synthetase
MPERLALHGGPPVRTRLLPYGRQSIDEEDVRSVVAALTSDWLTTGPRVASFERALALASGARDAVAVSSGTAALHAAMRAVGVGPGDEVIVPTLTFAATANAVLYEGATPVFADVEPDTLLLDPRSVEARVTPRTRAIVAVDYAGQPCDYDALRRIARDAGARLVGDACHALGASYRGRPIGAVADLTAFSFHPVKHVTTGEGGAVATDDPEAARRMRTFRNHGITTDHAQRAKEGAFHYEMVELGYNYRLTDVQCALGESQLRKLPAFVARRREIAAAYDKALPEAPGVVPLAARPDREHARHLYVVRIDPASTRASRADVFAALRAEGIGANVHYAPVHLHPYYRERFGYSGGECPVAEAAAEQVLSLPLFPSMTDGDADDVVRATRKVMEHHAR